MSQFTLQAADQSSSQLLTLPAELRVKILRYLLCNDSTLYSRRLAELKGCKTSQYASEYLYRSAQILCVCQQLFEEGFPIMYDENRLGIDFKLDTMSNDAFLCRVFDFAFLVPYRMDEIEHSTGALDLRNYVRKARSFPSAAHLVLLSAVSKFQVYEIHIEYENREHAFTAFHLLCNLVKGKSVHIKFVYIGQLSQYVTQNKQSPAMVFSSRTDVGRTARILDCASIRIWGLGCHKCAEAKDHAYNWCSHRLKCWNIAERPASYGDCFTDYLNLSQNILQNLPILMLRGRISTFGIEYKNKLQELRENVMDYDFGMFDENSDVILDHARTWIETWAEQESEDLRVRLEAVQDYRALAKRVLNPTGDYYLSDIRLQEPSMNTVHTRSRAFPR